MPTVQETAYCIVFPMHIYNTPTYLCAYLPTNLSTSLPTSFRPYIHMHTHTEFIPLVAEALGSLTEDAISTIRAISQAICGRSGAPHPATIAKHLFHRLAIALWHGNACFWLHRHPTLPISSFDGVV